MTRKEIEDRFKGMMLDYNPVGNRENSRKHGFWAVPVEKYKFKIIPEHIKDVYAIQIESDHTRMIYPAQEGIEWIQDLIRDKMEENADKLLYNNELSHFFFGVQVRRTIREQQRLVRQLFTNPAYKKKQNGKKNTVR